MNLYLYFRTPAIQSYKVPGSCKKEAAGVIAAIRNSGLSITKQEQRIGQLVTNLNQHEDDAPKILQKAKADLEAQKARQAWLWNVEDFFLFVPAWIGLYQALFIEGLENHNLMGTMPFGLANLVSALGAYIVCKLLMSVLGRNVEGWRRWLAIIGLFALFLGTMMASRFFTVSIEISVWSVILVCIVIFLLALALIRHHFEPEKQEPRIS